jgi:hypothetical protein
MDVLEVGASNKIFHAQILIKTKTRAFSNVTCYTYFQEWGDCHRPNLGECKGVQIFLYLRIVFWLLLEEWQMCIYIYIARF